MEVVIATLIAVSMFLLGVLTQAAVLGYKQGKLVESVRGQAAAIQGLSRSIDVMGVSQQSLVIQVTSLEVRMTKIEEQVGRIDSRAAESRRQLKE